MFKRTWTNAQLAHATEHFANNLLHGSGFCEIGFGGLGKPFGFLSTSDPVSFTFNLDSCMLVTVSLGCLIAGAGLIAVGQSGPFAYYLFSAAFSGLSITGLIHQRHCRQLRPLRRR
jgi:hypothetical protein